MNQVVVISDIFGRTPALETFCKNLSGSGVAVSIIDPYHGRYHEFASESDAYNRFMTLSGLDRYGHLIFEKINSAAPGPALIGFSVGASAIWQLSADKALSHVSKAFCFYPSQIRHCPNIRPCFDIELIFPLNEPRFDVDEMISVQRGKPHVACRKASGRHGFMNACSKNFDQRLYTRFSKNLLTAMQ